MFFILFLFFTSLSFFWFILSSKKLSGMANEYVKTNYTELWQTYESQARLMRTKPDSMVIHSIKKGELSAIDDAVLKSFKKKHQYLVVLLCLSPWLSSLLAQFIVYLSK
ncbi:hypothetical protein NH514_08135 [Pseudoalteromonas sp. ACER1]|uniref:hypothetical protein n=1 Tax=Pseudoalteromonas TaxID=53246 RepID=UPI00110ACE3E|nr:MULTISPECIES: hypothetical protein [unclassified Pseudoalteromonas]MCF2846141.1 hypothetical protein [Pseudoalteromonas sp. PAST1]MCO7210716.1 hypothetical protein [Pseudoalteromonas sp. ACER1]TMP47515.1 hypothetical protein CWB80_07270 [Pseudoalteromonas sp. S1650]TMP66661.1 hypothetical protein CWB79_11435 [Pseudoalteromonas sp. S1649]|tara:strand:+ start:158 stop:484 length:327 start_codon:yes stop_codon:yes gene_type:complete